jgi:two-component system, OmpR family, phosphate regulon sensor histidine kinase PhoR
MINAIWMGRRQVRGLIVLLALLPLIPTTFLVHTMWLNSVNDRARVMDEMNASFRNQLRLAAGRFSVSHRDRVADERDFVQFLLHVFGENLPMVISDQRGKVVYRSHIEPTENEFGYRVDNGAFAGWNIRIDSAPEIPYHIKEQERSTLWQGIVAVVSTMVIAGAVWFAVNRGLKIDEIRKDLITTISHEIKTPVSAIKILTESLEMGNLDAAQRSDYLRLIASENERIEQLANRFLTYGRLEKGQFTIAHEATELTPVLQKAIDLLSPRFAAVNGEICVKGFTDLSVMGDRNGLMILLTNLLENALKYGGVPPRVLIEISREGPDVILTISDNGKGIPKSEQKAVFRRFYRSEGQLNDGQTGVGLGLAICRKIAKLMKGSLTLGLSEKTEYGGAEFQVRLSNSVTTGL